jgi:hypothetical protein
MLGLFSHNSFISMSTGIHNDSVPDAHHEFSLEYLLEENSSD